MLRNVREVSVADSVYVLAPQYVGFARDAASESIKVTSCVTAVKLTLLLILSIALSAITVLMQSS